MSKTILAVDDEERLTSLVKAYLTQEGFRVVTARNGREALFLARQEKPDLIILDIMMPEMDGYEFMRLHRREAPTPQGTPPAGAVPGWPPSSRPRCPPA